MSNKKIMSPTPSRLVTPPDFTADFESPAKRKEASNVTIRPASHKNKLFVYLTQAGVEVWYIETKPGVDGEIKEFKKAIDEQHMFPKANNFVASMERRLNRSSNRPAANNSNMMRAASNTDVCRYVFIRIVDTSSLLLRLAMAVKLVEVRIMAFCSYNFNSIYLTFASLTFAPSCIVLQLILL